MFELNLALTLLIAVLGPLLAIGYVQPYLLVVLDALCANRLPGKVGAHFWIRSAYVMAIAGSLVLGLSFGEFYGSVLDTLRRAVWLTAAGSFLSVAFITRRVWAPVQQQLQAPAAPRAPATPAAPAHPLPRS
ncbi:hypothetical protein [Roseateles sp. BYS87W]|uniref:Uncharacterized protein n=1 Tax=Pelomonas baiyunensis TaxID=3299026 RepID=A0ABW7GV02_9BURK